jgi:hypothetical protein
LSDCIALAATEHQGFAAYSCRDFGVNAVNDQPSKKDLDMKKFINAVQAAFGVRGCGGPNAPLGWRWQQYHNI